MRKVLGTYVGCMKRLGSTAKNSNQIMRDECHSMYVEMSFGKMIGRSLNYVLDGF